MKKSLLVLFLCLIILSFTACAQEKEIPNESVQQSSQTSSDLENSVGLNNKENETTGPQEYISKDATDEYNAKASPASDFEYEMENGTVIITKYIGTDTDVVIPSLIMGKEVAYIAEMAFSPFGEGTGSPLESVKTIKIPDTVVYIDTSAFTQCTSLEYIEFPDSVVETGKNLFTYCSSLKHVKFSNQMKTIEKNTFYGVGSLESVILPQNLEIIGEFAFGETGIRDISIPDSLKYISDGAFCRCINLESLSLPEGCLEIGSSAFSGCTNLKNVVLPNSLHTIGDSAFLDCSNLNSINIPDSIENLGSDVFSGCNNLKF